MFLCCHREEHYVPVNCLRKKKKNVQCVKALPVTRHQRQSNHQFESQPSTQVSAACYAAHNTCGAADKKAALIFIS